MRCTACLVVLACPSFAHPFHEGHEDHAGSTAHGLVTERAVALVAAVEAEPPVLPQDWLHAFDDPRRRTIDYFPLAVREDQRGLRLGLMRLAPRHAAHELLRTVLGEEGYLRTQAIRGLEDHLREQVLGTSVMRIPDAYTVQFFGTPSLSAPWAFKFEGHHMSINATLVDGQFRGTPLFLGANPAEVRTGPDAGLRVLGHQEDLARLLLSSLDEEQHAAAVQIEYDPAVAIPLGTLPAGPGQGGESGGIAAASMTPAQRVLLVRMVESFARNLRSDFAHAELERLEQAGLDDVRFLWRGGTSPGEPFSFIVHGPTVVLQIDAVVDRPGQPANHLHALWRDPERDFGGDLVAEHHAVEHR